MASLRDRQLLHIVSNLYQKQKESFSRKEIMKQMDQVKYLSKQKKVNKFILQKKIMHLEHAMDSMFALEQKLEKQKKHESVKVASLKRQITMLKKRLAASQDKDLQKKIDKLNFLLGEKLAKEAVKKEVQLKKAKEKKKVPPTVQKPKPSLDSRIIVRTLIHRVQALKQELAILEEVKELPSEKVEPLLEKVNLIETKLISYLGMPSTPKPTEVKHTMVFDKKPATTAHERMLERELPLPPPPKMPLKKEVPI